MSSPASARGGRPIERADAIGAVDTPEMFRGASGGLVALVMAALLAGSVVVPAAQGVVLGAGAVIGYGIAGSRIGDARSPSLHGAVAASVFFLLALPVLLWMADAAAIPGFWSSVWPRSGSARSPDGRPDVAARRSVHRRRRLGPELRVFRDRLGSPGDSDPEP